MSETFSESAATEEDASYSFYEEEEKIISTVSTRKRKYEDDHVSEVSDTFSDLDLDEDELIPSEPYDPWLMINRITNRSALPVLEYLVKNCHVFSKKTDL